MENIKIYRKPHEKMEIEQNILKNNRNQAKNNQNIGNPLNTNQKP